MNTQVLGISTDPRPAQTACAAALGSLPYPLLSDFYPHGQVAQLYGVFNDARGVALRSVFLIDTAGVVRFKRVYQSAADIDRQELLDQVSKLRGAA